MLCFFVILLWTVVERFVAGVASSSSPVGLMEFALGRVSETWDVPVFSIAARNITTQHLFQVRMNILGGGKWRKMFSSNFNKSQKKKRKRKEKNRFWMATVPNIGVLAPLEHKLRMRGLIHKIKDLNCRQNVLNTKTVLQKQRPAECGNRADASKVRENRPVPLSACVWEPGPASASLHLRYFLFIGI